jgi:hypothetical protein
MSKMLGQVSTVAATLLDRASIAFANEPKVGPRTTAVSPPFITPSSGWCSAYGVYDTFFKKKLSVTLPLSIVPGLQAPPYSVVPL